MLKKNSRTAKSAPNKRALYDVVHSVLSENIRAGVLPKGALLRESDVTEFFQIGRMPAALALDRLEKGGLVHRRKGTRGFVVGDEASMPLRAGSLRGYRMTLAPTVEAQLKVRNWRSVIYPEVERTIASCLLFGRFQIRPQILAEHFGVSRTIANELLLALERVGVVRQESNARWYAGPLTPQRIKDLYEIRILLEPRALRQAAPFLTREMLAERYARIVAAGSAEARSDSKLLHRLEVDLHQDIVLKCTNLELRDNLYRAQLPLITVHLSFGSYDEKSDIPTMISAHQSVLRRLMRKDIDGAAKALESHLQRSSDSNPLRLANLPPLDRKVLGPYLDPV